MKVWVRPSLARWVLCGHRAAAALPRMLVAGAVALCALPGFAQALASKGDGQPGADSWPAVVTYVVDGDSIWVRSAKRGARVKLRLLGIDAPEVCQPLGPQARDALRRLALNQPVQVTVRARDRYGRALATVHRTQDGLDLSQAMAAGGWAWVDRYRGWHKPYQEDEDAARAAGRGLFAQAGAESPADFRRRHGPCQRVGK